MDAQNVKFKVFARRNFGRGSHTSVGNPTQMDLHKLTSEKYIGTDYENGKVWKINITGEGELIFTILDTFIGRNHGDD